MNRWMAVPVWLSLVSTGCLASKGDIQLLQEELRATRAQVAVGDTSILRADDARRNQIAQLSASIDRMNDSLRVLSTRFSSFQGTVNGELDAMGRQMVQFQALLGQTTRNVQDTREQLTALREQGVSTGAASPPSAQPAAADTSRQIAPGTPGPATLFRTGVDQLGNGNYRTARSSFDLLLTSYPQSDRASLAQLYVGDTYQAEGNTAAADSVYQLLKQRFPKSEEAGTALYKRGRMLWSANKKGEARVVLNRVIRVYPGSDAAKLASDLLNGR